MPESDAPPSFSSSKAILLGPSTNEPAPSYQEHAYSDIWGQWKAVDTAATLVLEKQDKLGTLEPELNAKIRDHTKLKQAR